MKGGTELLSQYPLPLVRFLLLVALGALTPQRSGLVPTMILGCRRSNKDMPQGEGLPRIAE